MPSLLSALGVGGPGFNPRQLSLYRWFDSSDASTLWQDNGVTPAVAASNHPVLRMDDKSGNGRHLTNTGGSVRPIYRANQFNGLPALDFDGADDYLRNINDAIAQPVVRYFVAQLDSYAATARMVDSGTATAAALRTNTAGNKWVLLAGNTFTTTISVDLNLHLFKVLLNGAASSLYEDGTTSAGNAGANGATGITIGNGGGLGNPCDMHFCEDIDFTAALAAADETALLAYLKAKWATP